jgi:hypothetical protein
MKRYLILWLIGSALMLATACNNNTAPEEGGMTDTSMTTMPAEQPPAVDMDGRDTAVVPRIDPSLDSAAKEKDQELPPK